MIIFSIKYIECKYIWCFDGVLCFILLVGKSGGGKAKSGIIVIGVLRLVGWEFERCKDPSCRLIVG